MRDSIIEMNTLLFRFNLNSYLATYKINKFIWNSHTQFIKYDRRKIENS